jgi:hypothetical protein
MEHRTLPEWWSGSVRIKTSQAPENRRRQLHVMRVTQRLVACSLVANRQGPVVDQSGCRAERNAVKDLLLLIAGIPFGVVANYIYQYARVKADKAFEPIKVEGKWGELTTMSGERRCSMGEIRYDRRKRMWTFDGTNYHNDGRPFCRWTTEASYLDKSSREFYYVFTNTLVESGQKGYIGFGVVRFRRQESVWLPDHGFFISGSEGESYRSHSMVPLDEIPTEGSRVREVFRSKLGFDQVA